MISYILGTVYSWPFFIGAILGISVWHIYCRQRAAYLDRHEPLPNGARHEVQRLNRMWVAGLAMILSIGYILLSANVTHDQTVALSKSVARCWGETYKQVKAQTTINAQNDNIVRKQQALQRDYDRATSDWLKLLVNPPADIAKYAPNDPVRQAYGIRVTNEYQHKLNVLGVQADNLTAQRDELDKERAAHPLPEATCGK